MGRYSKLDKNTKIVGAKVKAFLEGTTVKKTSKKAPKKKKKKRGTMMQELNRLRREHHKKTGSWFYPDEEARGLQKYHQRKK